MRAADRQDQIVQLTRNDGPARVDELAHRFQVTPSTIRRDLAQLTANGRITRTFGGVIPAAATPEPGLRQRIGHEYEKKRAIARWAAETIGPGTELLLDSGSTVTALAHELRIRRDLTVTTTGLTVVNELAEANGVEIRCLGGTLRVKSQGFVGPVTASALERMTFDAAFLGADGVSPTHGLCEAELDQTRLKELMARRARNVYVLAHSEKLGLAPFHSWANLRRGWTLVTDSAATGAQVDSFRAAGVRVVTVDVPDGDAPAQPQTPKP